MNDGEVFIKHEVKDVRGRHLIIGDADSQALLRPPQIRGGKRVIKPIDFL